MNQEQKVDKNLNEILSKARAGEGLSPEEVALILEHGKKWNWEAVFQIAKELTAKNFHATLHFFAPLYFSNYCINDCVYCGFQRSNRLLKRRCLNEEEFIEEARFLWKEGHRSLLLIAGEHPVYGGVGQVASYVRALRREKLFFSLAVEVGPLGQNGYDFLRDLDANQFLLFQETYDRKTYDRAHRGPKKDYDWRLTAIERARSAGIERVGLGILLGLYDYRSDLVGLIRHAWQIKQKFGAFPSTFSFPRLRPAFGIPSFSPSRYRVSDEDYEKIIALARIAVPSAGIVLTTREKPEFRRRLLQLGIGITHMSAGSATTPGGYTLEQDTRQGSQFDLLDHRPLKRVEREARDLGYRPIPHLAEVKV